MKAIPLLLLVFAIWLNFFKLRKSKSTNKDSEAFWERENRANQSRRKDISGLNYISIDVSLLPLETKEDQTLNSYRDAIIKLSETKILNLAGMTNTELKETYGAPNLNLLTEYENNYIKLVSTLFKWAQRLYDASYITDAQAVLEYAVSIKSDVPGTYKLLADIYKQQNSPDKIEELISLLSDINIRDKEKLMQILNETLLSSIIMS